MASSNIFPDPRSTYGLIAIKLGIENTWHNRRQIMEILKNKVSAPISNHSPPSILVHSEIPPFILFVRMTPAVPALDLLTGPALAKTRDFGSSLTDHLTFSTREMPITPFQWTSPKTEVIQTLFRFLKLQPLNPPSLPSLLLLFKKMFANTQHSHATAAIGSCTSSA